MRVLVSGSSGLVGRALTERLRALGHEPGRLVRGGTTAGADVAWDPERGPAAADLAGWDAVVHLAGKNLAALWTEENKRAIRDSRVDGTRGIAVSMAAAAAAGTGPRVLVSASAIGYYGSRGDEELTEESAPGQGFLADVCRAWEAAADPAREAGVRVVHPRFGLIFSGAGGPLASMLLPFRLGLGGKLGSGTQWMSWVTRDDVVAALAFALETEDVEGPVNVTAPAPVTNADFTTTLGRVLGRPTILPVPAFALKLLPGGMGKETLLASQRVIPARLTGRGFSYRHPQLESALRAVLQER